MKKLRKRLVATGIAALLTLGSGTQAFALDLSVPIQTQGLSNLCWAACSWMVSHYYGSTKTQTEIVTHVKGGLVNEVASLSEIVEAVDWATNRGTAHASAGRSSFGLDQIRHEISQSQPMIAAVNNGDSAHAYVISGASWTSNSITVIDPARGAKTSVSYGDFCSGTWAWETSANRIYESCVYNVR